MSRRFLYYLKLVAAAHILLVVVLVLASGWRRFFRPRPRVLMPIEFMVEVPAVEERAESPVSPTPEPEPEPEKETVRIPEVKPAPRPKKRTPINRSTKRITRTGKSTPDKKVLSEEEIRKLLERSVKAGDHNQLPDDDAVSLESIRFAFYNAWEQPSREETDRKVVRAEVSFAMDGRITGRRIVDQSGIAVMDASVMRALNAVTQVGGLTPEFLRRYPVVTIAFEVE